MNESDNNIEPFRVILAAIQDLPDDQWLYLSSIEKWNLDTPAAVLRSEEVPPELEDDPEAGVPHFAKEHALTRALPVATVKEVVRNALAQKPTADMPELLDAFLYYYDHDAFIDLSEP